MKKKLVKSSNNVVLTGSLAGIAEYFGIDPTIVRVIYVVLSFFSTGFPGFILYIVLSVVIPSSNRGQMKQNYHNYNKNIRKENPYANSTKKRKEAEKIDDDDEWSDF